MPDIVKIFKESRENKFRKKMETDPILAETKKVAEIVFEEKTSEIIDEINSKIYVPRKGEDYFTETEIANIKEAVKPIKGIDYSDGLPGEGGKDAEPVDVQKVIDEVLVKIPKPKDGKNGKDGIGIQGKKGDKPIAGIDFELPKDGSPDTPDQIADKLNTLTEKVDIKVIKGLRDLLSKLRQSIKESKSINRGGGDIVEYYDLSSQCNDVLKVFTIPENRKVISVQSTQFPITYRPLVDWTASGRILTLTDEVGAPQTGQTLWILYIR